MLRRLFIKNFTIIDVCEIDLYDDMTVLTGETGAGKSIVIDAIELALGARASNDVVRNNCERADIVLEFESPKIASLPALLEMHGLSIADDLVIRRTIMRDGRSKSFINDTPVTLPIIREIGKMLISIHGQHEFQTLLDGEEQLELLDHFAKAEQLRSLLEKQYTVWMELKSNYDVLEKAALDRETKADFLRFQLRELQELNLREGEYEELVIEHKKLAHADQLMREGNIALLALHGSESDDAAYNLMQKAETAVAAIRQVDDSLLKNAETLLQNASIYITEAASEINHFLSHVENDPNRLAAIEKRVGEVHEIAKKHHLEPEKLFELNEKLTKEYEELQGSDERLKQLALEIQDIENIFHNEAKKLTFLRKKAAASFARLVTDYMQRLGMPGGVFKIELTDRFSAGEKDTLHPRGNEKVLFLVSANEGQEVQSLAKVASGGELSRISLAIRLITAKRNKTPTLIFDEADIGIGGKTAETVGVMLRELGETTQVLCITHLPQVAAKGHHHLAVAKHTKDHQTFATIENLASEKRIREIARMSSGDKITPESLAHAKAMLKNERVST